MEIEQLRSELKEEKEAMWKIVHRVEELSPLCREGKIQKPKGLFRKKCPKCGSKLTKQIFRASYILVPFIATYFSCPSCDYEFGISEVEPPLPF